MIRAIEWINGKVIMLDQTKLPLEITFIECPDYRTVAEGIRSLWIRGAPAIGIAAAMGIALGAQDIKADNSDDFAKLLEPVFQAMLSTRPTAVAAGFHRTTGIEKIFFHEVNSSFLPRFRISSIDPCS